MNGDKLNEREREYEERERLEATFEADFPDGFDRLEDEVQALKQYGLYCGTCGHNLGCEHGVPAPRLP